MEVTEQPEQLLDERDVLEVPQVASLLAVGRNTI